jgi:RNA polymerase nonessential primary-like sigma factor
MRHATVSAPCPEPLLRRAHQCLSGTLQFDYLSNGMGHHQATALRVAQAAIDVPGPTQTRRAVQGSRNIERQYLADIARRRRLTSSEEYRLASAARNGDARARARLIEHHLGLVVLIARHYRRAGMPLLELIAEGNLGLMTALQKFDPERGWRFSTYAKWWIRQSIDLAVMKHSAVVRLPIHVTRALKRQQRQNPQIAGPTAPRPVGVEHAERVLESITAPEEDEPDWPLHVAGVQKELQAALRSLRHTERLVIQARYGVGGSSIRTLESLARQLHLSSERVRQIQFAALEKLRDRVGRDKQR